MTDSVNAFVKGAEQSDDLTMLAILYNRKKLSARLQRSITLPNDVQTIPQLATFIDEVCEALEFDAGQTMEMNLAVEEAVVNVMNYAYPKGTVGTAPEVHYYRLWCTIRSYYLCQGRHNAVSRRSSYRRSWHFHDSPVYGFHQL